MMNIRHVDENDSTAWYEMRCILWPEQVKGEHREEISRFLTHGYLRHPSEPWGVLVADIGGRNLLGFAELSIRSYAEGCATHRVTYLEGWFVRVKERRRGVGRSLILASEEWGRSQGCTEFASDASPSNTTSIAAHQAVGFTDVGSIRCFRKAL